LTLLLSTTILPAQQLRRSAPALYHDLIKQAAGLWQSAASTGQ